MWEILSLCDQGRSGNYSEKEKWLPVLHMGNLFFLHSYEAKFHIGPPIRCEKYQVSADLCDNMGLTHVIMPTMWSAPDQSYAAQHLAALSK